MTDRPRQSGERTDDQAPELHNSEQDDEQWQTHTVAEDALEGEEASPLDSEKGPRDSDLMDDSTQDLIDHMRDMEQSGRVDMDAYRGEPNHDDNEDKYGEANKLGDLPGDGTTEASDETSDEP